MNKFVAKLKKIHRLSGILFILFFSVSLLFPIFASMINKNGVVLTIGFLDVAIAFLCVIFFFLLVLNGRQSDPHIIDKTRRITEYVVTVPLILIVMYFIGVKVNWEILLIGLGWRFWLLILALPYLVSALDKKNRSKEKKIVNSER